MSTQKICSRPTAWMLAPLLVVACDQPRPSDGGGWPGDSYARYMCNGFEQVLSTDGSGQLICKDLPPGAEALPDCKKYSQALTSDGKKMFCTNRNKEAQTTRDALDNLEQSEILIKEYATKINSLGTPLGPAPRAVYCGQFVGSPNPNGGLYDPATGVTGIRGAAELCRRVTGCSATTAKMCTVYDLYHSAALNKLPATVTQSWVFMASWQHNDPAQVPTASGLADNCASFTYPLDDKRWYGTTVEWKDAPSGHKALHFASGPGVVACSSRFPVACCN